MCDELTELAVAQQVARQLVEQRYVGTEREAALAHTAGQVTGCAVLLLSHHERGMKEAVPPEA
ncbi:hypothetical protein ACFYZJ_32115 [Streptomyces sp. NPDC001848]|uniref:hypothetical protein n=1 Tax=Streptomyces sp. NPDC001848 TaxID=3364618 RepID=UPI003688AC77